MYLAFLVQGKETHKNLVNTIAPEGVKLKLDVPYGQDGDNLFIVKFEGEGESLALARKMSEFRDDIFDENTCHLLIDDPSERFCEHLFSEFGRFERTLRSVLRLALCSGKGKFKDPLIKELESQTLEEIFSGWFCSKEFQATVCSVISGNKKYFSKEQLVRLVENANNNTIWNRVFSPNEMKTVRERFKDIQARRNDVMHFHRISYRNYIETYKLLKKANEELEQYNDNVLSTGGAEFSESIIGDLNNFYTQMGYQELLSEVADRISGAFQHREDYLANIAHAISLIDYSAYRRIAETHLENSSDSLKDMAHAISLIDYSAYRRIAETHLENSSDSLKDMAGIIKEIDCSDMSGDSSKEE